MDKQPRTVLFVDDSGFMVEILQLNLKRRLNPNDYQFLSAKDGLSALKIMEERTPDIVVVDLMMPKLDGFGFCKEIKANSKYEKTKLAILTALDTPNEKKIAEEMGIENFFVKSMDPMEMVTLVQDFIEKS